MTTTATSAPGVRRREYRLVRPAAPSHPPLRADSAQREVVDHTAGPLLVIGGPGTGKTATLVEAVAARVAAGTEPDRILVLTFGRRGAIRLRDRLEARLAAGSTPSADRTGPAGSPLIAIAEPQVRTFHGYAFGLLRHAAVAAGDPPPRLLTGPEQDLVIRELLAGSDPGATGWPKSLRAALGTRAFATELRDLLLRCAERGIGPRRLAEFATAYKRPDWAAAARFFREYLQVLALREATVEGQVGYDYAELVRAATRHLRDDPELLAAQRRHLACVYVDELADTDPAQIDLLAAVAGGGVPLVAFADPDSSTFAFRGADPGILDSFADRFRVAATGAPAPRVTLSRSYRSHPALVAAARRVGARLRGPARHRDLDVVSVDPAAGPEPLEVRTFGTEATEAAYVAQRLRQAHLVHGVPWSRMAVIVRSAVLHLAGVRRALLRAGVPTVTQAEDLPLHLQPAVAVLLRVLRCALDPARLDEEAAVALLHSSIGGADPLAERQLRQGLRARALAAGDRRLSGVLLVEAIRDPAFLAGVDRRWAAGARTVAAVLAATRSAAGTGEATAPSSAGAADATAPSSAGAAGRRGSIEDVLWAAWSATGLAERWAAASALGGPRGEAADRDLDAVVALFDAAARFADRLPGAGPAVFADYVEGQDLPADSLAPVAERGQAVQVLTAHAAKGREWDLVAVVGVQEGIWPDLRLRGSVLGSEVLVDVVAGREMETVGRLSALLDEERRLFYVAVTRARRQLIVTAVEAGDGERQPSRFLAELAGWEPGRAAADAPGADAPGADAPGVDAPGADAPGADAPGVDPPAADASGAAGSLSLASLVAQLRVALVAHDVPADRRAAAAALLARLAGAGVTGAAPDQWWGLRPLSDTRPLADAGEPVRVTPSTVESVQRCSLRWLLERHGGAAPSSAEQGIGNLVHAAAMLADTAGCDRAALAAYIAERFDAIELSARWLVGRERGRVDAMLDKLVDWLARNPRRLIGIEREFLVELSDPKTPVEIRGRVDRLEVDSAGRLVVIDLKTGRSAPAGAELTEHAQLAAYQVAIEAGAFSESPVPGGALLVQLGGAAAAAREQVQPPLAEAGDPGWAHDLVRRTAKTMAAATFEAVANDKCRVCPVSTSCPLSGRGTQVVQDGER